MPRYRRRMRYRQRLVQRRKIEPAAIVFDMDGILAKGDAAHEFFKRQGMDRDFWDERILTNKAFYEDRHAQDVEEFMLEVERHHRELFPDAGKEELGRHNLIYPGAVMKTVLHKLILERRAQGNPLHVSEMRKVGEELELMDGAAELIEKLRNDPRVGNRIYINTAAYEPIAKAVARRLGIPEENVFSTRVDTEKKTGDVLYMPGEANILGFKRRPLRDILRHSKVRRQRIIAVGDSFTDADMLSAIAKPGRPARFAAQNRIGGVAIAHLPSQDLLQHMMDDRRFHYPSEVRLTAFFEKKTSDPEEPKFNTIVAGAPKLSDLWPVFRAFLRSRTPEHRARELAQVVAKNAELFRTNEQPEVLLRFGHDPELERFRQVLEKKREEARGKELADKTKKD